MIKKLTIKLRQSYETGLFHDSRKDCNTLAKALNQSIDKINELTITVNNQTKLINELKTNINH